MCRNIIWEDFYTMMAAISSGITVPVAVLSGIVGVILALLSPLIADRLGRRGDNVPSQARLALLFFMQIVAAILLFTAGKAFGIIPILATPAKVGIIAMAALVLTGFGIVLHPARG
jgi:hypothetical protein